MEYRRLYTILFALLTILKIAAPEAPHTLKSILPNLFFNMETVEMVETLGRNLIEYGHEDAVQAMSFGDCP